VSADDSPISDACSASISIQAAILFRYGAIKNSTILYRDDKKLIFHNLLLMPSALNTRYRRGSPKRSRSGYKRHKSGAGGKPFGTDDTMITRSTDFCIRARTGIPLFALHTDTPVIPSFRKHVTTNVIAAVSQREAVCRLDNGAVTPR
jgi:hypothetical protein